MKHVFQLRNGERVGVLRPDDPERARRMHDEVFSAQARGDLTTEQAIAKFNAILSAQPHTFVGLLAVGGKPNPKLLNEQGWAIGTVRPGDAFVPFAQVQVAAAEQAKRDDAERAKATAPTAAPK